MNALSLLKMPLQMRNGDQSLFDAYGMFLSASPLPDNVTPMILRVKATAADLQAASLSSKAQVSR
ncbi:hypothetical protein [Alteromonas sp. H39]|uniref:hypothetical protein n=1 Tax=Alteromonas sp. H39 TaxID=3389876 RepID=UPI0039DF4165